MYEAAASCKDIVQAPVTNWEPQCVTLAGYSYAVRHGMKVQLVVPYGVSHSQRYGVRVGGKVMCVPTFRQSYQTIRTCQTINFQIGREKI